MHFLKCFSRMILHCLYSLCRITTMFKHLQTMPHYCYFSMLVLHDSFSAFHAQKYLQKMRSILIACLYSISFKKIWEGEMIQFSLRITMMYLIDEKQENQVFQTILDTMWPNFLELWTSSYNTIKQNSWITINLILICHYWQHSRK